MEIIVVKMMNVSGNTLWNILFMKENTKMNKDKNIHHCNYCEKKIPIVILENGVEWTAGYEIKGKIGRYCNPCKNELEER
tara:strand:- start:229 stop:468 length:240 start_codon:yes stop_codon:yes gene_type:complete